MEFHFSEMIKQLRKEHGLTQEQLAEALGVTTGAVYKWENGLAMPEIKMLVELADFFEISVDFLLDYEVQKGGVDAAISRIRTLRNERKLVESAREAEKALQKYPNHFKVIYQASSTYFLLITQDEKAAHRCIELLERACQLFDQNPYESVTLASLQESIATCYIGLKQYDKSIELLKKLNINDSQSAMIGMILAQFCHKPEEALPYLSDGFYSSLATLMRITVGFAQSYIQLARYEKALEFVQWTYHAAKGLRDTTVITFLDKVDAVFLTMMADISERSGDTASAYAYLRDALAAAHRFDAAPEYRTFVGMNFYHSSLTAMSIDDMGATAYLAIEDYIANDACSAMQSIWKEITDEANN